MGDLNKLVVHLGRLTDGKWVAATGCSPYFCVEADTEDKVKALAKEALAFYERALGRRTTAGFAFTSKVTAKELVAA